MPFTSQAFLSRVRRAHQCEIPALSQTKRPKFNDRIGAYLSALIAIHYKEKYVNEEEWTRILLRGPPRAYALVWQMKARVRRNSQSLRSFIHSDPPPPPFFFTSLRTLRRYFQQHGKMPSPEIMFDQVCSSGRAVRMLRP